LITDVDFDEQERNDRGYQKGRRGGSRRMGSLVVRIFPAGLPQSITTSPISTLATATPTPLLSPRSPMPPSYERDVTHA
jgi:hypothetical protein